MIRERLFRVRVLALMAAGGLALTLVSGAAARAAEPSVAPPGFKVRASNGYTLSVIGFRPLRRHRGSILLLMRSKDAQVIYSTEASIGPTSIEADLGALGRIDVEFMFSGQSRAERPVCGGQSAPVDSGRYEGTIDFVGEEGYSEVHANSARGEAVAALSLLCPDLGSEGYGGDSPGARLVVSHRSRHLNVTAFKNSPTRPARFAVDVSERRRDMSISRSVEVTAAPGSFDFDVRSGRAHVSPPSPFSGEATYLRPSGSKIANWHGDLSIDFPGRAGVRLTGTTARASLQRAVLNPSHPFRLP